MKLIGPNGVILEYDESNPQMLELEKLMNQFDNYELTTLDYALKVLS